MSKLNYAKNVKTKYTYYGPEKNPNSIVAREINYPATDSQKTFMEKLGLEFKIDMTKKEARWAIQDHLDKKNGIDRTKQRYQTTHLQTLKSEKKKFEKERRIQEYRGIKKHDPRAKPILQKLRQVDRKIQSINNQIKNPSKFKQVVHRAIEQDAES